MFEITIKICTVVPGTAEKNDDCYRKGRGGGGQKVMIEIIISVNDENDGLPLRVGKYLSQMLIQHCLYFG